MSSVRRHHKLTTLLDPAFIVGAGLTLLFYAWMFQPSMQGSFLHRYTTAHTVDYVIVAMWFWAITDLAWTLCGLPREVIALRENWLPSMQGREPVENAEVLLRDVEARPEWLKSSRIGKRLTSSLEFVVEKGSGTEFQDHLRYLADQDDDKTHSNYALARFVVGAAPVLGFLGTVIHFGGALSNISFEELESQLFVVVGEMGQAFNTTTAALAVSMCTMFLMFMCERFERSIIRSIDRMSDRELQHRFEVKDANVLPFLSVIRSANDEALKAIGTHIANQTAVWNDAFDRVLTRFDQKQQENSEGWQEALKTLSTQHVAYDQSREERFSQILSLAHQHQAQATEGWQESLKALSQRHEEYDAHREQRLSEMIRMIDERQEAFLDRIHASLEKVGEIREDFAKLVQALQEISRGEGDLVMLQSSLAQNLQVLHETQHLDEAMHGLTAAIHLMTARGAGGRGSAAA